MKLSHLLDYHFFVYTVVTSLYYDDYHSVTINLCVILVDLLLYLTLSTPFYSTDTVIRHASDLLCCADLLYVGYKGNLPVFRSNKVFN